MVSFYEPYLRDFVRTFVSRRDDFAVQQADGRYSRVGHPLTYSDVRRHLSGQETLATYVMDEQGMCRFAVYDCDLSPSEVALEQLAGIQTQLRGAGIPSHLEESRRGGHLWVLFDRLAPASFVRRWLMPFYAGGYSSGVMEFYPKQDEGVGVYGSLIRLPFGVHRLSGGRYGFVTYRAEGYLHVFPIRALTVEESLAQVAVMSRAVVPATLPTPLGHQPSAAHTPSLSKNSWPARLSSSTVATPHTISEWCASHDPFSLIGRYVELDTRGMGCCPFGWHHASGVDTHPSLRVYAPRSAGGSCWYCYTWGQGGTLFDFLRHFYNIDAKSLWRRILMGEHF